MLYIDLLLSEFGLYQTIVKIIAQKHAWGPDFLMSDTPYIFQLFLNELNCAAIQDDKF